MKNFNEVITVEISVDSIANMLLEQINPEFKHRELLVESVVGRALSKDKATLGLLYNSLNGHKSEIDFTVGDIVKPSDLRVYGFWTPESITKKDTVYGVIEEATVIQIDVYADDKLLIAFDVPKSDGTTRKETKWVRHTTCNKIAQ